MKRVSSRGNPWHDERGRFCTAEKAATMKCGNEHVMVETMSVEERQMLSQSLSKASGDVDTQEYYRQQTADRSRYADSLSRYTPGGEAKYRADDTPEQRENRKKIQDREVRHARALFDKENAVAIRNGATVTMTVNEDTGEVSFNVYDAREIVNQTVNGYQTKGGRLHKDTSTNMRTGEGYVVTADADADLVRSCKTNASRQEMAEGLSKYIEKHKEELAEKNKHICTWMETRTDKDGNRVQQMHYTISTWYKDKQEAVTQGNLRLNATVADCTTGKSIPRNKSIVEAERKYKDMYKATRGNVSLKAGEYAVGDSKHGGVVWNGNQFVDTATGEVLTKKQVWARGRVEREQVRGILGLAQRNAVKRN